MDDAEMLGAIALGTVLVVLIIVLLYSIFTLIAIARTMKKGGKEGWKAIVPIYNTYTLCEICGVDTRWIIIILVSILFCFVPLVSLLVSVISIYFQILLNVSLAKSFGKEPIFALGLILLPPVFYWILSNGDYNGPVPMEDEVFKFINSKTNKTNTNQTNYNNMNMNNNYNNQTTNNQFTPSYCPNCGNKISEESVFCANCGTKVK